MVARECERHHRLDAERIIVHHDRTLLDRADAEDRGLWRVDDGREPPDPVHAQVRDCEGTSGEVVRTQASGPSGFDQPGTRTGDLLNRSRIRISEDRDDQAL